MCWYIPAYRAFKTDSSFNFFIFFFIFFFQVLFPAFFGYKSGLIRSAGFFWWWLASREWATVAGLCPLLRLKKTSPLESFQWFLPSLSRKKLPRSNFKTLYFSICLCFALIMLRKVHEIYRSTGATFGKAMTEGQSSIGTTLWSNEQVRTAATSAATQAAQHTAQVNLLQNYDNKLAFRTLSAELHDEKRPEKHQTSFQESWKNLPINSSYLFKTDSEVTVSIKRSGSSKCNLQIISTFTRLELSHFSYFLVFRTKRSK